MHFISREVWKVHTLRLLKRIRWITLFTKYLLIASTQARPHEVAILSCPMEVSRAQLSLPSQQEFSPFHAELSLLSCFGICTLSPSPTFGLHRLQFQLISFGTQLRDSNATQSNASTSACFWLSAWLPPETGKP